MLIFMHDSCLSIWRFCSNLPERGPEVHIHPRISSPAGAIIEQTTDICRKPPSLLFLLSLPSVALLSAEFPPDLREEFLQFRRYLRLVLLGQVKVFISWLISCMLFVSLVILMIHSLWDYLRPARWRLFLRA
jgi:hypothetical protein